MKTLAQEIEGMLSADAVTLADIASRLGADLPSVRRAAQTLNDTGRALLVRRRRVLHLASTTYAKPVCKNCHAEFERKKKSKAKCCCKPCSMAWSWTLPGTKEKRIAAIKVERATPAAKLRTAKHNAKRWSHPGEREKLSEQNRREWADPVKAAKRAAGIRAVNGSAESRERASAYRKAFWQDPETRDRMIAALRAAQTPETSAARSRAMFRRYGNPVSREKYLEVSRKNIAKATAAVTGRKQSPEHIRKRTETMKRTKALQRSAQEV